MSSPAGEELDGDRQASALQQALSADGVPADAGGIEVSARQRLSDLYCHRRRTGIRAHLFATGIRYPAGPGYRLSDRDPIHLRQAGTARPYAEKGHFAERQGVGKAENIYLFLGQHPKAAFGNSTGDQQMLEYTQAGGGASLEMLVLHDDAQREYAYGPAQGLPDTKVGKFTQALYEKQRPKAGPS